MLESEFSLLSRFVLVFVYFYSFWFFCKNFYKSKAAGFINKFFVGYTFFFLALFGVQLGLSLSELSAYLVPGSDSWIRAGFPGSNDLANVAKVLLFPKMALPIYVLGLSAMLALIAGQIYPLEVMLNWKHLPGTKFLLSAAAVMPLIFIPVITWSIITTILLSLAIIGVIYGLSINIGVNIKIVFSSTGELRRQSMIIFLASLLFYVGFIFTLEIKEISPSNAIGIDQRWDIVIGSILQGISILLYRNAFKSNDYRKIIGLIEYYQSKHFCIVHRGNIKGPVFMCSSCGAFYCARCKTAIVEAENKCWNCGNILVKSSGIFFSIKTTDALYEEFLKLKQNLRQETSERTLVVLMKIGNRIMAIDETGALPGDIKGIIQEEIDQGLEAASNEAIVVKSEEEPSLVQIPNPEGSLALGVIAGKELPPKSKGKDKE